MPYIYIKKQGCQHPQEAKLYEIIRKIFRKLKLQK